MRKFEIGEVVAERRFEYQAPDGSMHNVEVRLGRPTSDGGGEDDPWVCPFQIAGLGSGRVMGIFGVDSLQALLLAVHTVPVELAALLRQSGGRLLSFGEPDSATFLSGWRTAIQYAGDVFPSSGKPREDEDP